MGVLSRHHRAGVALIRKSDFSHGLLTCIMQRFDGRGAKTASL